MGLIKNRRKKIHLPEKRAINFAAVERKKKHYGLAAAGTFLIIVLAAGGSKYLVIDRMNAVFETQKKVTEVQKEIDALTERIAGFGEIQSDYEHNRISGLTQDEISFTNRLDILDMLNEIIFPQASVSSWTLSDNTLKIPVTSASLQDINELIQQIEEKEYVDYCTVASVITGSDKEAEDQMDFFDMEDTGNGTVTGNLVIYLNNEIPDQVKTLLAGGKKK